MARAWQRWAWITLWAVAVSVASELAAQTLGEPADGGAPFELSSESRTKTAQRMPTAAPPKEVAAAEKEIEAGIASLQARKNDIAVQRFTAALSAGSLPGALMAKALYHRGVAFRRWGKPVQAISDLTSALWFKNGLGASDRADALAMRAAAYRDAGLPDQLDAEAKKLAAPAVGASHSGSDAARSETDREASEVAAASAEPSEALRAAHAGGFASFFGGLFGRASSGSSVQTGAVSASPPPPTLSGWVDNTEVRKGAQ